MLLNFEAEAKNLRPKPEVTRPRSRPRPKLWPRGQIGLEALTSLTLSSRYFNAVARLNRMSLQQIKNKTHYYGLNEMPEWQ